MLRSMLGWAALLLVLLSSGSPGEGQTTPVPSPPGWKLATAQPQASEVPLPTPDPGVLVRFVGQLLDLRPEFVYFTTGDAFRLAPGLRVVDLDAGGPYAGKTYVKLFARATLDPVSARVYELGVTRKRLPSEKSVDDVRKYAAVRSTPQPAPEIAGRPVSGRPVAIQFLVEVPPSTPINSSVYIATDFSGWSATAIKMDRIDGSHYRAVRTVASGTKFAYRYTRGSWNQVESGDDGLETAPREFFVDRDVDVRVKRDRIARWSDQSGAQPQVGPDALPTPYNPDPFGGIPIPGRTANPHQPRFPGQTPPPKPGTPP